MGIDRIFFFPMRDTAPGSRGFDTQKESPTRSRDVGLSIHPITCRANVDISDLRGHPQRAGLHHSRTQVGDRSGVRRIWLKMFDVGWPFVNSGEAVYALAVLGGCAPVSSALRAHGRAWLSHGGGD